MTTDATPFLRQFWRDGVQHLRAMLGDVDPAGVLRRILCDPIEGYIDALAAVEPSERDLLLSMAASSGAGR